MDSSGSPSAARPSWGPPWRDSSRRRREDPWRCGVRLSPGRAFAWAPLVYTLPAQDAPPREVGAPAALPSGTASSRPAREASRCCLNSRISALTFALSMPITSWCSCISIPSAVHRAGSRCSLYEDPRDRSWSAPWEPPFARLLPLGKALTCRRAARGLAPVGGGLWSNFRPLNSEMTCVGRELGVALRRAIFACSKVRRGNGGAGCGARLDGRGAA